MSKYYVLLFLFTLGAIACNQPDANQKAITAVPNQTTADSSLLIIPGRIIGKIILGEDAAVVEKQLGRPDYSDAAIGSALFTWYAKHDTAGYRLSIFGTHNYGGKDEAIIRIKKIRVTSPAFKTVDGINTGADKASISQLYKLKTFTQYVKNGKIMVCADVSKGIAFEINSTTNKCVAIMVFKPNDTPATYIDMH